jgi:hypothetical protein
MRVGRNDACPCGSGRKFKACCEGKRSRGMSRGLIALMVAIGVIAAVGVVASIRDRESQSTASLPSSAPAARTTPRRQPPGPAPAGKVWSAEHGHWHDQAATTAPPRKGAGASPVQVSGGTVPVRPATPKPQPPGPAPAGQVWSAEHGHWHDARTP